MNRTFLAMVLLLAVGATACGNDDSQHIPTAETVCYGWQGEPLHRAPEGESCLVVLRSDGAYDSFEALGGAPSLVVIEEHGTWKVARPPLSSS